MEKPANSESERLAKRIASAGICSRRDAEKLIENGEVKVNGEVIRSPATNVSASDVVEVKGKTISTPDHTRLWLYHKPSGLLTTHKDPKGRPTVFASLPKSMPRVISVGRLDLNSEGLLLLTNSGDLARTLELPKTGLPRTYHARMFGTLSEREIKTLDAGIAIDGIHYGSIQVKPIRKTSSNSWVEVTLHEGKNREIRKVFEHLNHPVSRLIRTSYGPFELRDLPKGHIQEIPFQAMSERLKACGVTL